MNDLKELADYVVEHPEAYEYRWRLAKKLYMAWEYNEALRHLLILKRNWSRKLNVLRYLAATLFRIGRYEDAIKELDAILVQWPSEVPVWEQLAKVHEAAGNGEKAAEAWERVLRLDPDHSIADRAIKRLRAGPANTPRDELHLADSDSGINLRAGKVCENCGAQNSDEFDRCWQCHASLTARNTPIGVKSSPESVSSLAWLRPLTGGLVAVAGLSAAVYIALSQLPVFSGAEYVPESVYGAVGHALYFPRLAIGIALIVCCPLALSASFRLFRIPDLNFVDACGAGILVASVSYALLWIPLEYQHYAVAGPAAATAFVALLHLPGGKLLRLGGAWLLHSAFATALGAGVWWAMAGTEPLRQWPEIVRYSVSPGAHVTDTALPSGSAKFECSLVWATTGSPWLDSVCGLVALEIVPDRADLALNVQVFKESLVGGTLKWEPMADDSQPPYRITQQVEPGTRYIVHVLAPEQASFHGMVRGILPVSTNLLTVNEPHLVPDGGR
jgi:hypothetical protein